MDTTANSQSQFFKHRAGSHMRATSSIMASTVLQKPDEIMRNMLTREQKLRDMGVANRKIGNQSGLTRHKPNNSIVFGGNDDSFSAFNSNYGDRQAVTAKGGSRAKASRLILKQRLG